MIYILENSKTLSFKIGFSKNVEKRIATLSTASSSKLKLITTHPGTMKEEKILHTLLKKFRINGEWFTASHDNKWFWNALDLIRIDGAKVIDMDISEIDNFCFCQSLPHPSHTPVLNLK